MFLLLFCCYLFHMPFNGHLKRLAVWVVHTYIIILSYLGISSRHQSTDNDDSSNLLYKLSYTETQVLSLSFSS